jgi:hypothetical protein
VALDELPVPVKEIVPAPVTLVVPEEMLIPHEAPPEPWLVAVMLILLPPETVKLPAILKALHAVPVPLTALPNERVNALGVVTVAPTLTPWQVVVPVPPVQEAKASTPERVRAPPILTPWLEVPDPPLQLEKVTVALVAGDQEAPIETPLEPVPVLKLVPDTEIVPLVLLIIPAALPAMFTPKLAALPVAIDDPAVPVREMLPLPVVVETVAAPPVMLIPWEAAVVLAPPVPINVIEPPPVVDTNANPVVSDIPWQAPVVPKAVAVMAIVVLVPVL